MKGGFFPILVLLGEGVWLLVANILYTAIKGTYNKGKKVFQKDAITTFTPLRMITSLDDRSGRIHKKEMDKYHDRINYLADMIIKNEKDINPDGTLKNPKVTEKLKNRLKNLIDRYNKNFNLKLTYDYVMSPDATK